MTGMEWVICGVGLWVAAAVIVAGLWAVVVGPRLNGYPHG